MRRYTRKSDIFKSFPEQKIEFEFGIEQEMLLTAISKKSNEVYNLNIASDIVEKFNFFTNNDKKLKSLFTKWSIKKEYSKCLIEFISPSYEKESVDLFTRELNYIKRRLNKYLPMFLLEYYPLIYKNFFCELTMDGTSKSCKYINIDLSESNDIDSPESNVLEENIDFVLRNKNILIDIGKYKEPAIGIYNHLSSFHITFHPTYIDDKEYNIRKYLTFFNSLSDVVKAFKHLDIGNKEVIRNGKKINLK